MVSIESVSNALAEQQGLILILMQEGDNGQGMPSTEWADEMYNAYELVKKAIQSLDRAQLFE